MHLGKCLAMFTRFEGKVSVCHFRVVGSLDPLMPGVLRRGGEHSGDEFEDLFAEAKSGWEETCLVLECVGCCGSEASQHRFHDLASHG